METLPVRNNSLSIRTIGPLSEGGPKVTILPGQVAPVPVDLLSAMEGNKAFLADVEAGKIAIGVVPAPEPLTPEPGKPEGEGEQTPDPDSLLNS